MLNKKLFVPAIVLIGGVLAGGVMIASAQDASNAVSADNPPIVQVSQRDGGQGGHHGRGDHGERGDRGGPDGMGFGGMGFGGRGGPEVFQNLFTQVDADKDGTLTQAEIDTFRAAQVASADASKDGSLSIDEFETLYRSFIRPKMVDAFQNVDADGDGQITKAELDARLANVVARLDRNDDGALSLDDRGGRGFRN
jgi:EF hand